MVRIEDGAGLLTWSVVHAADHGLLTFAGVVAVKVGEQSVRVAPAPPR